VGGTGSGRRRSAGSTRLTTDQLPAIDVGELRRQEWIAPGQERVDLLTRFRTRSRALAPPGKTRIVELVAHLRLTWTNCNFGGSRPWFLCDECGRRVALVYGPPNPPVRVALGPSSRFLLGQITYVTERLARVIIYLTSVDVSQ
jgi:hypothetical protein